MSTGSVFRGNKDLYSDDSRLLGDTLTWPTEVSTVQSQCSELLVAASYTDFVDTLGADTGVGGLSAELKLSLLAVRGTLSTGCGTFMTRITRDTHPTATLARASDGRMWAWSYLEVRDWVVEAGDVWWWSSWRIGQVQTVTAFCPRHN